MSPLFCLIIVVEVLQFVLCMYTGQNVHEIYVERTELLPELTISLGAKFGNKEAALADSNKEVSVNAEILAILARRGIAFFKGYTESENYIVVPNTLKNEFTKGSFSRYVWSFGGDVVKKELEEASVKMVVSEGQFDNNNLKITMKSLDFTIATTFGKLVMTFGVVCPGMFFKEKSKSNGSSSLLIIAPFTRLKNCFIGNIFTPEFKEKAINDHPVLSTIKMKITEFSVTLFTGEKKTVMIDGNTNSAVLDQTMVTCVTENPMDNPQLAVRIPGFEYAMSFKFTTVS